MRRLYNTLCNSTERTIRICQMYTESLFSFNPTFILIHFSNCANFFFFSDVRKWEGSREPRPKAALSECDNMNDFQSATYSVGKVKKTESRRKTWRIRNGMKGWRLECPIRPALHAEHIVCRHGTYLEIKYG